MERIITFITQAHSGQYRLVSKDPYHIHLLRVEEKVRAYYPHRKELELLRKAALLHDVIEDTWVTLNYLRNKYSDQLIKTLDCLTKRNNESIEEYMVRLKQDELAMLVKICDVLDNCEDVGKEKEYRKSRKQKYNTYLKYIDTKEKGFQAAKQDVKKVLRSL